MFKVKKAKKSNKNRMKPKKTLKKGPVRAASKKAVKKVQPKKKLLKK